MLTPVGLCAENTNAHTCTLMFFPSDDDTNKMAYISQTKIADVESARHLMTELYTHRSTAFI